MQDDVPTVDQWRYAPYTRAVLRWCIYGFVAFCIIVPIRIFIAQPFIVSGASMEPTMNQDEYLVIDELTYRTHKPERGDVVIFRYPLDPSIYLIKRVIGMPGETVYVREGVIRVSEKGSTTTRTLIEPYRLPEKNKKKDTSTTTLDDDEYFVMGDNRDASMDSRVWGPLQERLIVGRVYARLYPFDRAQLFPGAFQFSTSTIHTL